jgi:hypothetical protein
MPPASPIPSRQRDRGREQHHGTHQQYRTAGAFATVNNIGTTATFASTNNIGSTKRRHHGHRDRRKRCIVRRHTQSSLTAGATLATNGTSGTTSGSNSGGLTVYNTAQTIGPNTTIRTDFVAKWYFERKNLPEQGER